jgi:hypothetical protein
MPKDEIGEALCVFCSNLESVLSSQHYYYLKIKKISLTGERKSLSGPYIVQT